MRDDDHRGDQRQLDRGDGLRAWRPRARRPPPRRGSPGEQRGDRQQHEHREVDAEQAAPEDPCRPAPEAPGRRRSAASACGARACRASARARRATAADAAAHEAPGLGWRSFGGGDTQRLLDLRDDARFRFEELACPPCSSRRAYSIVNRPGGRREAASAPGTPEITGPVALFAPRSSGRRGRAGSRRTSAPAAEFAAARPRSGSGSGSCRLGITYSIGEPFFWSAIASSS